MLVWRTNEIEGKKIMSKKEEERARKRERERKSEEEGGRDCKQNVAITDYGYGSKQFFLNVAVHKSHLVAVI